MFEEIKKEINSLDNSSCCNEVLKHCCINYNSIMEILDKYNNQDYKSAWEELKETLIATIQELNYFHYESLNLENRQRVIESKRQLDLLEKLSKKYNLDTIVERVDKE